jgi:hypothetical protein
VRIWERGWQHPKRTVEPIRLGWGTELFRQGGRLGYLCRANPDSHGLRTEMRTVRRNVNVERDQKESRVLYTGATQMQGFIATCQPDPLT